MTLQTSYRTKVFYLITASLLVRTLLALLVELSNDEAYYYTYALYPDLSHFDHPPMVGWFIRIFSLNLLFQHELFIRLSSVITGAINTWLMFQIGKHLKDDRTGWYAALLYVSSIYGLVITGVMILPDTPQMLFWLLALNFLIRSLTNPGEKSSAGNLILASILTGLGMLSKYTTIFLWAAMIAYVVFHRREWLRKPVFYISMLIPWLLFIPVIIWNIRYQFISFSFHGSRIEPDAAWVHIGKFLTEILGEILYIQPVVWVLIWLAVTGFVFKKHTISDDKIKILIWAGLPLVLLFLFVSLFKATLPHWNAPGYISLLPLAALWLATLPAKSASVIAKTSLVLTSVIVLVSFVQIQSGMIPVEKILNKQGGKGEFDYSLEVYGWKQLREHFNKLSVRYEESGEMSKNSPVVTYRWFPAGNYEYYLSRGTSRVVLAAGDTASVHKYAWINALRGGFKLNSDAWYITSSRDFKAPAEMKKVYYQKILGPDTITITRCGKQAYSFYVYRLKNLQGKR